MPSKKPSAAPSATSPNKQLGTAAKPSTQPLMEKHAWTTPPNPRQQPDNRWQRSKRYGWDGR